MSWFQNMCSIVMMPHLCCFMCWCQKGIKKYNEPFYLELCLKLKVSYEGDLSLTLQEMKNYLGIYEFVERRENDVEAPIYMMNNDKAISWIYNNGQEWQGTVSLVACLKPA